MSGSYIAVALAAAALAVAAPRVGAADSSGDSAVRARKLAFLNARIDWWKDAGYPLVHLEGKEWKFDEIEPCWAGAHAAMLLKRTPEEVQKANEFFEKAPIDWDCDPDMRICELLHSFYAFTHDKDFSSAARKHLLEIFDTREAPRRLNPSVWKFRATENHAMMGHVWRLLLSQIEGNQEEVAAVTDHISNYITEHARKGWQEFYSPCYVEKEIGCMVMLREWAADERLQKLAGLMLDMLFAEYAVLDIDGMMCGPCARAYGIEPVGPGEEINHNSRRDRMRSGLYSAAHVAFGDAEPHFYGVLGSMCLATSDYTVPDLITRLALAREKRGSYEFCARKPGIGLTLFLRSDKEQPDESAFSGRIYCYATPDFVLGTSQQVSGQLGVADWHANTMLSTLVVRGSTRKLIYLDCGSEGADLFQHKNVLVGRVEGVKVYAATRELGKPVETGGWIMLEDGNAYIALRPDRGGCAWEKVKSDSVFGDYLSFEDQSSPFVMEIARPSDYGGDFGAFKADVLDNKVSVSDEGGIIYESCSGASAGPSSEAFTVELRPGKLPLVDGKPANLMDYPTIQSPYVNSAWNSGVVTVSFGGESLALDFNKCERR